MALRSADRVQYPVPTLKTKRLTLRPLTFDDADELFPAFSDDVNMRYWSRGPIESVEALREYMAYNVESAGVQCFAITESARLESALGWVVLIDRSEKQAELGYILRPDAQRRGVANEAVAKVVDHAFDSRGFRRVYADIDPDNKRSIASIEALGFSYEGRLRATWETHLGVRDSLIYSQISTDRL